MKVSIIIPTLGREEGLKRCLDSIEKLNYPKELIETIVIKDEPRLGVPKRVNEGFAKSTGELIVFASNDVEFAPDSVKIAVEESEDCDLVAFNTGSILPDEGNICEHFLIKREFVNEKLNGKIFDEDFNHCGVDNLLWAQVKKCGKALRSNRAILKHYHFTRGEPLDDVYKIGWEAESVKKDRELLKIKLQELNMPYDPKQNKIEGMMGDNELIWLNEKASQYENVVEIGSWKGKSAHALLSGCKSWVHSVDHFQGSADPIETGNKDVYADFINNVGHFNNLIVHKKDSIEASKEFEDGSMDMVFIDGGHQYDEVVADIKAWEPKAKKLLCGHDWQSEAVKKAVYDTLGKPKVYERIWYFDLTSPLYKLAKNIREYVNFSFVKMGDGEMIAMSGAKGANCDGQEYSPKLQEALKNAYKKMGKAIITRWKLGMEKEISEFENELGIKCEADHDLLLNRVGELNEDHFNFWKAIKDSKRRKIFIGPERLKGVVDFLNIDKFIEVPLKNAFDFDFKLETEKDDIILFSAGMASKVWIGDIIRDDITIIDCGSAFDPLFVGNTRTNQVSIGELKKFYQPLLSTGNFSVVVIAKNEEKTLPRLLESVKGVDEVVVCDTGSTDKTIEVAKKYGAKVVEGDFREVVDKEMADSINALARKHGEPDIVQEGELAFNFSKARNFAASQARNDIIFMPDCDEIVDWDLEEVKKIWINGANRLEYNFIFAFDSKGNPQIQFLHSKFYDRRKYTWKRNIHEIIIPNYYTNKIEGWMTDEELNFLYELSKKHDIIVEVGSWKGRSTNALCSGSKGNITAIDHFKGSASNRDGTHGANDDEIFEEFTKNTKQFTNLKVVRKSGEEAVKDFEDKSFDMVFIDAGHTYEEVKNDIDNWLPKAKKIICGHDYSVKWPEVMKAVDEKLKIDGVVGSIWFKVLEGEKPEIPDMDFKNVFTDKILLKHYQNPETSRTQYLKGLAIDNYQNEYNDRNAHYYARELYYRGWHKSAIEMFKRHIDNPGWDTEQGQSYIFMGNCYEKLGNIKAARQCYLLSMELEPRRREPYLALAGIYYGKKEWDVAERWYKLAITIPKKSFYATLESNYGHFPLGQLAVCLFYQGKKEESLEYLKKALELDPTNQTYLRNLQFYS